MSEKADRQTNRRRKDVPSPTLATAQAASVGDPSAREASPLKPPSRARRAATPTRKRPSPPGKPVSDSQSTDVDESAKANIDAAAGPTGDTTRTTRRRQSRTAKPKPPSTGPSPDLAAVLASLEEMRVALGRVERATGNIAAYDDQSQRRVVSAVIQDCQALMVRVDQLIRTAKSLEVAQMLMSDHLRDAGLRRVSSLEDGDSSWFIAVEGEGHAGTVLEAAYVDVETHRVVHHGRVIAAGNE